MFKRGKKFTSLLVAATSVISIVPAYAAEMPVLETKTGSIDNAIVYNDGKYIYQGEAPYYYDSEETTPAAIYYNDGENSQDITGNFENTYLQLRHRYDGNYALVAAPALSNNFLFNFQDESVTTYTMEDELSDAMNSKLSGSERYGNNTNIELSDDEPAYGSNLFGEFWSGVNVLVVDPTSKVYQEFVNKNPNSEYIGQAMDVYGICNRLGDYTEISKIANISFTDSDGVVKHIPYYEEETEDGLTAKLNYVNILAEDQDYVYILTQVEIDNKYTEEPQYEKYIQKISKEQGELLDGVYLPASVSSYKVNDEEAIFGDNRFVIKDNMIYVISTTDDMVEVGKYGLVEDQIQGNYMEKDMSVDHEISYVEFDEMEDNPAVSIDVDGYIWCVDNSKIYMLDGDDWIEKFQCDESFNSLDVYNEDNLIVWEDKGDEFGVLNEADSEDDSTTPVSITGTQRVGKTLTAKVTGYEGTTDAAVTYEWSRLSDSDDENGESVGNEKAYKLVGADKGKYIRVIVRYDGNIIGTYTTGKIAKRASSGGGGSSSNSSTSSNSEENNGVKETVLHGYNEAEIIKAINDPKMNPITVNLSYSNDSNKLILSKEIEDALKVHPEKRLKLLYIYDNSVGNSNNSTASAFSKINGNSLLNNINKSDAINNINGFNTISAASGLSEGNSSNETAKVSTNPVLIAEVKGTEDGHVQFTQKNVPLTGFRTMLGGDYALDSNGIMITGWVQESSVSPYYYFDLQTGNKKKGWLQENNEWYYLDPASGIMKTGWLKDNNLWYYFDATGKMKKGWFQDADGKWYFFNGNGAMVVNTTIDGCNLGADGAILD